MFEKISNKYEDIVYSTVKWLTEIKSVSDKFFIVRREVELCFTKGRLTVIAEHAYFTEWLKELNG